MSTTSDASLYNSNEGAFAHDQPSQKEISNLETNVIQLNVSFERVAAISDPVKQEYELIQEAKKLEIPVDSYRRMFEVAVASKKVATSDPQLLRPFKLLDQRLGDFVKWCENISLYQLATVVGQVTLLLAMGSYFIDAPQRHQQALNDAAQTIRDRSSEKFSQDRIDALLFLSKNCENISGLSAPEASMPGINLNNCYKFNLSRQALAQFPPQFFQPKAITLAHANLEGANLEGADLTGINLTGANLAGANLANTNLSGANLEGANLRKANLEQANLTGANLKQSSLSRANLTGANLEKADLAQSKLLWTNLTRANLRDANLSGANLNRANLQGVDFYTANLQGASFRHADLTERTNLREANVKNADFRETRFWSVSQPERAQNWQQAHKNPDWQARITQSATTPKVALIRSNQGTIFDSYKAGIASVQGTNLLTVQAVSEGVEAEAQTIRDLVNQGVDAILLRPSDPEKSVPAIKEAYEAGAVIITIGDCINNADAGRYVFACYESDSFQMGYDLTAFMSESMSAKLFGQPMNVGMIDGSHLGRAYPYFRGFEQAVQDAGIPWRETASVNAYSTTDLSQVKAMLKAYPDINVLWCGTNTATELAVQAVKDMRLNERVMVYGILDLTRDKAMMLLDDHNPLQSIVDENPHEVGRDAATAAVKILNGESSITEYQHILIPYRLLGQSDKQTVQELLNSLVHLQDEPTIQQDI